MATNSASTIADVAACRWHHAWRVNCDTTLPLHFASWAGKHWRAYLAESSPAPSFVTLAGLAVPPDFPLPSAADNTGHKRIEGRSLRYQINDQTIWLGNQQAGARLTLPSGSPARLELWGEEPGMALYVGLHEAFAAQGWFQMHAGVVRWSDEQITECFLGRSGTGKSCTTQQALKQGAQPLGEDTVWIHADTALVLPTTEFCRLNPDAFSLMPWLPRAAATTEPDGKLRLSFADLGVKLQAPSTIDRVTVLQNFKPSTDRIAKVQALWEAFRMPLTADGRTHLQRLVNLLVQRP